MFRFEVQCGETAVSTAAHDSHWKQAAFLTNSDAQYRFGDKVKVTAKVLESCLSITISQ